MSSTVHDVLIVGGGPSGLAAALVAGRARLSTVLFDAGQPRNAATRASHGFLSRDGVAPLELLRIGRDQLRPYPSVRVRDGFVTEVARVDDGFEVHHADGSRWLGRRILLATGYRDDLASAGIPGLADVYGTSVFPCPFCDGFEHADERIALFADGEVAQHMGPMLKVWSDDVVLFTNGRPVSSELRASLEAGGVPVHTGPVQALLHDAGVLRAVEVEGVRIERDSGFIGNDIAIPATPFAEELGVGHTENAWGMQVLDVDPQGRSGLPGLYVVGDARSGFSGVTAAAQDGHGCMANIVHEIARERWESQ